MSDPSSQFRRNVAAVIVDGAGRVLLGRKKADSKYYHFPQGGVGKKELFETALWREIFEETGLKREQLQICTRLSGLRYHYRKKNKKREKWKGQEQTYYLLRLVGDSAEVSLIPSSEFQVFEWVPISSLSDEKFVSFKRNVVTEVLHSFFPQGVTDLDAHFRQLNILMRYQYDSDSHIKDFSAYDRAFFAGDKSDARLQMADLQTRIVQAQDEAPAVSRALIIIHALPASFEKRRTNTLRHISALFNPLYTKVLRPVNPSETWRNNHMLLPLLTPQIPESGQTIITSESPYQLLSAEESVLSQRLADWESVLIDDGVLVLKFFLLITPEQWERLDVVASYEDYLSMAQQQLLVTSQAAPWYVIPSEKKWYRDYVIASIIAESFEKNAISSAAAVL